MRMFSNIFLTFFLLIFLCLSVLAGKPVDVLFCAYDTGESNVIRRLIPHLKEKNMSYAVAGFGQAVSLFKEEKEFSEIVGGSKEDRSQKLSEHNIKDLQASYAPKIVFAGIASAGQAQVLNAFPKAKRIAFYDNFDAPKNKEFIQPFLKTISQIDLSMVPADFLVKDFQDLFPGTPVEAVGQPVLEEWEDIFKTTDRTQLRGHLGLEAHQHIIVFAGGMDDTYPHNLNLFVKTVAHHPEWKVFITYHPKTDGSLEKSAVEEARGQNITVSNEIKTNVLATVADVLVCHKSSVCQQALSVGVPCVYVAEDAYHNFLIDQGLVQRLNTMEDLEKDLVQKITEKPLSWQERLLRNQQTMQSVGIPNQASEKILSRLAELMRE